MYAAIYLTGHALLCLNDPGLAEHGVASQPAMTPETRLLQAQVHAWQLGFVALIATGFAFRSKRPAWRISAGICWIGILYLLLRFAIT